MKKIETYTIRPSYSIFIYIFLKYNIKFIIFRYTIIISTFIDMNIIKSNVEIYFKLLFYNNGHLNYKYA